MKPKNKYQREIVAVQSKLKPISDSQMNWGIRKCFPRLGVIVKKRTACFECGHTWMMDPEVTPIVKSCTCPSCGEKLKLEVSRKRSLRHVAYYGILTVCAGYQVYRMAYLERNCRIGSPAKYFGAEVMQHWVDSTGRIAVFSLPVNGPSHYIDLWRFGSTMELREENSERAFQRHSITPDAIHPKCKILPIIARNGFKGNTHGMAPAKLFRLLLTDSKAETLLKVGQIKLLKYRFENPFDDHLHQLWPSIKICIRNNYVIKDATTWFDYVELLRKVGKDLLNSHFVCPENLRKAHNEYVALVQKLEKVESESDYQKSKGRFFGLRFADGKLEIKVLDSIEKIKYEGAILKHCVYVRDYHKKLDSLLMSAYIEGEPVETIEISLSKLKIVQSRGFDNLPTEHNARIVALVNKNLQQIGRILRQA